MQNVKAVHSDESGTQIPQILRQKSELARV